MSIRLRGKRWRSLAASATFKKRYGPWALVAGASEGLGEAFARGIAAEGVNVALVARRAEAVERLATKIRAEHGVEARAVVGDLSEARGLDCVITSTADLDVGLLVYNAAYSFIGPFGSKGIEEHRKEVAVNVTGPLSLSYMFGEMMAARGRGGIVLMSSMAGFQGSALIANYAATKAYNLVLAEGLWDEWRERGVDVLACCAGATRTPNYEKSEPADGGSTLVPVQESEDVAREALAALGKGPILIPGRVNRLASFLMRRIFGRRRAVKIMGDNTRSLYSK